MSRFATLRLVTSPTHLYKKLDEFGQGYNDSVKEMVETDAKWFAVKVAKESDSSQGLPSTPCSTRIASKPSPGFKLTIDNVDYRQNVHYTTEDHQNIDKHYVTVNSTTNRVSGNHLSTTTPVDGILKMENGRGIPNHVEQKAQRDNYITLVQRILVDNIPCLGFGKDIVQKHIPHKYSKESAQSTSSVSILLYVISDERSEYRNPAI